MILEVDSLVVINLVQNINVHGSINVGIIHGIKELLAKDGKVKIKCTYRKENTYIDWMANNTVQHDLSREY